MWSWLVLVVVAQTESECSSIQNATWVNSTCQCLTPEAAIWGVQLEYHNQTTGGPWPSQIPLVFHDNATELDEPVPGSPRLLSCSPPCSMANISKLVTPTFSAEKYVQPYFCEGYGKNKLIEGGRCYLTCPGGYTLFSRKNPLKKILPIVECKNGELVLYPFSDTICSQPFYEAIHIGLTIAITFGSVVVSILVAKRNAELGRSKSLYALWFESILVWLGRIYAVRRRDHDDLTMHDVLHSKTQLNRDTVTAASVTLGDNTGCADASPMAETQHDASGLLTTTSTRHPQVGLTDLSPAVRPVSPFSPKSPEHNPTPSLADPSPRHAHSTSFGPSAMQMQRETTEGDVQPRPQVVRGDDNNEQDGRVRQ